MWIFTFELYSPFFLLICGAILFAALLRAGTNFVKDKIKMPDGLASGITSLVYFVKDYLESDGAENAPKGFETRISGLYMKN